MEECSEDQHAALEKKQSQRMRSLAAETLNVIYAWIITRKVSLDVYDQISSLNMYSTRPVPDVGTLLSVYFP
jgi:hypothetical protein